MTTVKVTLRAHDYQTGSYGARRLDGKTLDLPHLPRKGDYINDGDCGEFEVVKVCYNTLGGSITLYIR